MTENPYRPPKHLGGEPSSAREANKQLWPWVPYFLPSILGFVLLIAATTHRFQFDDAQAYRSSPLVPMEVLLMLGLLLIIAAYLFVAIVYVIQWRWFSLFLVTINIVLGFALLLAAACIDAPTLVYMT